jgi:hypothetical protein
MGDSGYDVQRHFQQYISYIAAASFNGWGNGENHWPVAGQWQTLSPQSPPRRDSYVMDTMGLFCQCSTTLVIPVNTPHDHNFNQSDGHYYDC